MGYRVRVLIPGAPPTVTMDSMTTQRRWLAAGLTALALGVVALVAGAVMVALRESAYPWHAGIASTAGGSSTASVTRDDGTVMSFTGTADAAQDWLDAEEARLRDVHGISARTAAGEVLRVVGGALLLAGAGALVWRTVTARRARPVVPA
jgi:hypothetical protein